MNRKAKASTLFAYFRKNAYLCPINQKVSLNVRLRPFIILAILLFHTMCTWADNMGYSKAHPLVVGIDLDYAPLEYVDEDGIPQGFDVKFTQELMRRMDIPYTYSPNTWAKISEDVINGHVDLGMMVYSPYRKHIVNYSRAVFRLYYQIVFRTDTKDKFDVRNLGGKSVAYMASRPVTDTLTRAGAVLNIVEDLPHAFRELSRGEYDAVICFRYQAKYLVKTLGLQNLKSEDLTLTPREYCYVSRSKELIDCINLYLEQMEQDGTINDIYGDDITSQFGSERVPQWVWIAFGLLIIASLFTVVVMQYHHSVRLKAEMERLQRSEQLKTIFLGNVSHALRTPLNAVIGFSDVLSSPDAESLSAEERNRLYGLINENGQQLLHYINELLQLSTLQSNDLELNRVEVDMKDVMSEYGAKVAPMVQEGVQLNIQQTSLRVVLDPKMLQQVTMHLLRNAVQHTSKGSVNLNYKKERNGLEITISDTGEGLPEELKDNIFGLLYEKKTFVQAESPGLGLSICQAIVERCGGYIRATTEKGKGTTFWFWIPVAVKK